MRKPTKPEIVLILALGYCSLTSLLTLILIDKAYAIRGTLNFGGEIIPLVSIPFVLFFAITYVLFNL